MSNEASQELDNVVKNATSKRESWEERQEAHDKREEAEAQLRALDVNSCISHRATIESYLAAQVEVQKDYNALIVVDGSRRSIENARHQELLERSLSISERTAAALEKIADYLAKPVTFVSTP